MNSNQTTGRDPRFSERRGEAPVHINKWLEADGVEDPLRPFRLLRRKWRVIILPTAAATLVAALLSGMVATKWYRAEAIIHPTAETGLTANLGGSVSSIGVQGLSLGSLSGTMNKANEFITRLQSFTFNMALVQRHHLATEFLEPGFFRSLLGLRAVTDPRWRIYWQLKKRFDCEYSISTNNIVLHFEDPDRFKAERILGFYIDDLRDRIRNDQIRNTTAVINSMLDEAKTTPDTMLQTQLYELIAREIQKRKLAQAEADFAFEVLEPPVAPDSVYSPSVFVASALAGLITLIMAALVVLLRDWVESVGGSDRTETGLPTKENVLAFDDRERSQSSATD